ncbi:hypothetical protein BV25DRAFT_1357571 [Artomyces pyxidatus]|uniref:Uncharacterized protein n=1 Tax=Artomyces pyxidatus TaxID=48021 RepID=A0ACB8SN34_9AGAM|nr:hypothetical protein BV25DRAFT_1357571 [Artomyces pyxidatus]
MTVTSESLLPEQYLTLLSLGRSQSEPFSFWPWFQEDEIGPHIPSFVPCTEKELLDRVLDAVAFIAVHKTPHEAFATALSIEAGQVTLYVAANGSVSPETVTHLQHIWDQLGSIARGNAGSTADPDMSSLEALRNSIYAFHMAKLRYRFDKYFEPFAQAFMPEARSSKDLFSYDIKRLESLLQDLTVVRDIFDSKTISEDQRTRDIARCLAAGEKTWRKALAIDAQNRVFLDDGIFLCCPYEVHGA